MPPNLNDITIPDIDGAALLDDVRKALTTYVVLPSDQAADAVTLWIAATHGQPAWEHAPRLAVISPEKRCGKSRLMDVVEAMCHHPFVTVNASVAAVVRSIAEDDPPTLCVDEADTIFGTRTRAEQHEDLRGILNAGHQRNRPYVRYDMTSRSREDCPTFAMAMLAAIGDLPDTVMDRAVVVRMRRRATGETVAPFRSRRDRPGLHDLRDRLGDWLTPLHDELAKAEPELPVEDRAADTWEPLVEVADLAGGHWPERARGAVVRMVGDESEADVTASRGALLLADIRELYANFTVAFMPSSELVTRLRALPDAPWSDTELTTHKLAAMLHPYGIGPGHNTAKTARGYRLDQFTDAFARYLPS